MTDSAHENLTAATPDTPLSIGQSISPLRLILAVIVVGIVLVCALIAITYQNSFVETADGAPILVELTLGQLALWMSDQSTLDEPESLLGQAAKNWALAVGQPILEASTALNVVRVVYVGFMSGVTLLAASGFLGLLLNSRWTHGILLATLVGMDVMIFMIPALKDDNTLPLLLMGIFALLIVLLFSPGRVTRFLGFMVVLSGLFIAWEAAKGLGAANNFQIGLPQASWTYTTYDTVDETLAAVSAGEIRAAILDKNDVEDDIAPYPEGDIDPNTLPYPNLRILSALQTTVEFAGLPVRPAFPGRLAVVVPADDVAEWTSVNQLIGQPVGTLAGDFADTNFLSQPRNLVLIDLKITNDLNMPHLQSIAGVLLQPARRQGPVLLVRILSEAALFTWLEAAIGFVSGAFLGFCLGALFAHSPLMSRGLLPYVVASQTVPILAVAPIVVLWLGAGPAAVAVISAYLTFFPVTINTLRGLTSPKPTALELMRSYAAKKWSIMWKLRFPAALPYIFTALKVSATTSVVGAIIGELPSGIRSGLGGAILNFNQYYTSDPAKLWAAIFIAALVGIAFFLVIGLAERVVLNGKLQSA